MTLQVSVIVPTYNRLAYLKTCLDSVAAQCLAPAEVLVVDDGSTDGTLDYLRTLEPDVTVISQQNAGPGAARNRGAAAACGEYLAFLDSDDVWFPWSLKTFVHLIEAYGKPTLLFARFIDFHDPSELRLHREELPSGRAFGCHQDAAEHGFYAGAGMVVVARERFLATGGFVEDRLNSEDHDLALRLGTAPGFVQTMAPVTVGHRVHGGNETADEEKTILGSMRLIARERAGLYPGGPRRARQRRDFIATRTRPVVVACIRGGNVSAALRLYGQTFFWNLRAFRWRFLLGVPALMAGAVWKRLSGAAAAP